MGQVDEMEFYNEYRTKIVETVKTHKGSCAFQKFLEKVSINTLNMIIEEIKDDFGSLMSN